MNFLPYLSLFAFLFNIFWSEPVRILSKEYELASYYLTSKPLIDSAMGAAALALLSVFLPKKFRHIPQSLAAFVLIATALYSTLIPYSYGSFTSNEIFSTEFSLLGFSRWYYLLDAGILLLSAAACVFLFKKKLQDAFFGFFLFYYVSQSFFQFQASRFTNEPVPVSSVTLSEDHTNVLYLIYDSTPSIAVEDIIKNVWTKQQKEWTKDFTLYDNTAGIGVGGTPLGLPAIFGGYQFPPQRQLARADSGAITEDIYNSPSYRERHKLYPPNGVGTFFMGEALQYLDSLLPEVDVSYDDFGRSKLFPENKPPAKIVYNYPALPYIGVSLYGRSPYFLRWIFAESKNPTLWSDVWHAEAGWMPARSKDVEFSIKETTGPVLAFAHFLGTHDVDGTKNSFEATITEMMTPLNDIIFYMKEKNIYDRTKIIVSSDHGILDHAIGKEKHLHSIASPQMKKFYKEGMEPEDLDAQQIPSLCMVKDFASDQGEMAVDSRLISLADMHGVVLNAFGNTSVPDYTSSYPGRRRFNIPYISWRYIYTLVQKNPSRDIKIPKYAPKKLYMEVNSVKDGEIYVRQLKSTNEITALPVFEWAE